MRNSLIIILIGLFALGCFGKNKNPEIEELDTLSEEQIILEDNHEDKIVKTKEVDNFYPIKQSISDIKAEMNELKSKIVEYESRMTAPTMNADFLKLIKIPQLKHEITLKNGTIIQGAIFSENVDRIIIQTQIGQLIIEKGEVVDIKEVAPPQAHIVFEGDAIEEIYPDYRIYKGMVRNDGLLRADFVRVIYNLWKEDTEPIGIDSAFVDGSLTKYASSVISDCSIEPGESASFKVKVIVPNQDIIRYTTRNVQWSKFE
jgi:hypothetical protein